MAPFLKAAVPLLALISLLIFSRSFHGENQHINFQPPSAPIPSGYQIDDGSYFLIRGEWGWITDDDLDGLPDWWEVLYFGSIAYGPDDDFDSDGLTNLDEYTRGTDAADDDTDSDGWRDGYEVGEGSNPMNETSYPLPALVIFSPEDGSEL